MKAPITPSVAPFQHDDLPNAAEYIRLLKVLNDNYSEVIKVQCEITTWPISEAPSYHAISYTWGDPESNTTILINGEAFQVRKNCEFVLKQAYWFKKANYYWVDSICINQENLAEKGMQVSIMGVIFKEAAHVLACVGEHADDSALFFKELERRAFTISPLKKFRRQDSLPTTRLSLMFQLRHRSSTTTRFLDAAFRFIGRPYFTRMWILQEVRNARDATFLCGSDAVPKDALSDTIDAFWDMPYRRFPSRKVYSAITSIERRIVVFRRFWAMEKYLGQHSNDPDRRQNFMIVVRRAWFLIGQGSRSFGFLGLIGAASELQCQDRKDKVFGLISLIDWDSSAPLVPDYTQTEFEVAVSFFRAFFNAWMHGPMPMRARSLVVDMMCGYAVDMLDLGINSNGVPAALQARRTEPGSFCSIGEIPDILTNTWHRVPTGWYVSSEHLAKDDSGFWIWSPPGPNENKIYLPDWTHSGDWVLSVGRSSGNPFRSCRYVLVREIGESFGGPLLGHAFCPGVGIDAETVVTEGFWLHWDPEDLVVYELVQRSLETLQSTEGTHASDEWVKELNTAVCGRHNSSYTFCVDVSESRSSL